MILGGISVFKRFVWNITIAVILSGLSVFRVDYIYYNGSKWNVSILGGLQWVNIALHLCQYSSCYRQITTIAIILGQISIFQLFSSES